MTGRPCTYGGQRGLYPSATSCRQLYSNQRLLALNDDASDVYVETFSVPSACVCAIVDAEPFEPK